MNIRCSNSIKECLCEDSGAANLSAEMPDVNRFLAPQYFLTPQNFPSQRINHPFNVYAQIGCAGWAYSTVSQDDAIDQANQQALLCQQPTLDPPLSLFGNTAQECTSFCPNGAESKVVIPAGRVSGLSQEDADVIALSLACSRADEQAHCVMHTPPGTGTRTYYNVEYTATCLPGTVGEPDTIPAGQYSSTISQFDADSYAIEAGNESALQNCRYYNTPQTASCPPGTTGSDFTVPAGHYSSRVSQEDANQQAYQAALNGLNCTGGNIPQCSESNGSFDVLHWNFDLPSSTPPCAEVLINNGFGTWKLHYEFGPCELNFMKSKSTICNSEAPYPFTVKITGHFTDPSITSIQFITFNLVVDGDVVDSQTKDIVNGFFSDVTLSGTVPGYQFTDIEWQVQLPHFEISPQKVEGTIDFTPKSHP